MSSHFPLMRRAIELAQRGQNTTTPNPYVGCVLVKNGQIIGEGFHQRAGLAHAEIEALNDAKKNGHTARGATVYVTLEPCSHVGKTPPCADALIAADVAEVIIGSHDPNPQVSGQGVAKLRQAGIAVTEGVLREQCDALNRSFFKRMTTGMPWVTVKLGMSLDAKIATAGGESQWITGEAARADVQQLRAKSCAVMTSSATVIADNPSLNVRLPNTVRQPKRVIVDSQLCVSRKSRIFGLSGETLVYTCIDNANAITVPEKDGHADLTAVLKDLGSKQHCNHVLVEAGGRFAGALIGQGLVDELIVYSAPKLLGDGAKPAFAMPAVAALAKAPTFYLDDCAIIGGDLKVTYRK